MAEAKKDPLMEDVSSIEDAAKAAEVIEELAKLRGNGNIGSYTYTFRKPFTYEGRTYETLTFDWDQLTGADSLAIENSITKRGRTLVIPAYTGEYLVGMAVRACTERTEDGRRVVGEQLIRALPLGAFQSICNAARDFLLVTGS